MLHKYKDAFSLRDEISAFSNIEVEIGIKDKYLFFIKVS